MNSPLTPQSDLLSSCTAVNPENLKLWLCELTHLSPQQIDRLLIQREQQQAALIPDPSESTQGA
jgi:hypothetical protein